MAADNISFLTPLLTSCGVIAGFLSARHQHISSLIRKKTEYIFCQYHELRTDLSEEEIKNMMAQIVIFYDRNKTIEKAVYSALAGGIIFAVNIVISHKFALNTSAEQWMNALVILGLIALTLSLCLAIYEFSQSIRTLDLEIILAGSKTRPTSPISQTPNIDDNLSMYMYKGWEKRRDALLGEAKKINVNYLERKARNIIKKDKDT